ncbi:MAG: 4Fe-4S binding protein [Deltaproteobacteria bacterium]|jgi:plastocyanin|nr:4Fe-4S binding protein [Deltaproteobacteria bacterium]MBT4269017.1 4Fe-4S binding protein [Deltaproteobacteria bacterium]MBT4639177.1 4Fe-4S binding protein [Deltaproteobacteria bacterium]MBT6501233.1 4Fe-4S binding protein [Deltaproteobacteria bacterium]MBT6612780.1 4Fe-4S binding protein [Deltaproteobacteria bacterium]
MGKKKVILTILGLLVFAIVVPIVLNLWTEKPQTHIITLEAKKYGYSPSRIKVNKGDTIIFKPTSLDVTHGFLLDGYDLEFTIKQEGITFLKYSWEEDDGSVKIDWDKVDEIELLADRAGKFTFRCIHICGNLHPFMTGELIVLPNHQYFLAVSLSLWVLISLLLWFRYVPQKTLKNRPRIDLLKVFPWLDRLVKMRGFHFFVLLPNVIIFYLFIISSLWGSPVGNRNIAIIFVWILWWFALKAFFVPLGARLWCMICPLPAPAEWLSRRTLIGVRFLEKPFKRLHHKYLGLQWDWPKKMQNMWLQNIIFMIMISFGIILITRPVATASLFLLILGATLILALFFRRRVFCQFLCPVGGFLGNYSMASVTEIRAVDYEVCRKHKEKSCLVGSADGWGCTWNQYIGTMERNNYCGFCMECLKSCPKDNIGIFVQPFGSDKKMKGYDEMFNIIIMLVVAIAFSVTMLGPWSFIKDAANVTESGQVLNFIVYVAVLWTAALVIVPWIFIKFSGLSNRISGDQVETREIALQSSYALIPVGIFAWIAFSLPSVLVNYNYILSVLSDPLGLGWDIFGTANMAFQPFYPQWIPAIQGGLLLTGLYFGIDRGFKALEPVISDRVARAKAMIPPAVFAWVAVNVLLKLYMS